MRELISVGVMFLVANPLNLAAEITQEQLALIPAGVKIKVSLKSKQKLKGTKAEVSPAGFTLLDSKGKSRQIELEDIDSVEPVKSHTTRNALIVTGVVIGIIAAVAVTQSGGGATAGPTATASTTPGTTTPSTTTTGTISPPGASTPGIPTPSTTTAGTIPSGTTTSGTTVPAGMPSKGSEHGNGPHH